jgi:hypothetical protein
MKFRFIPATPKSALLRKLAAESLKARDYAKTPAQWNAEHSEKDE